MSEKEPEMQRLAQLGTGVDLTPGPDGKPWVRVQILAGVTGYAFTIPVETGEDWISQFERQFRQTLAVGRQQMSGLVVAKELPNQNGNRAQRRRDARESGHGSTMGN